MTLDEHARHLGGLLGNLQSLEFALRVFLDNLPEAENRGLKGVYEAPVGAGVSRFRVHQLRPARHTNRAI